jgi:hypothetical protein
VHKSKYYFFSSKINKFRVHAIFYSGFSNLKACILTLTPANTSNIEIIDQTEAEKYLLREKFKKRPFSNLK